jgi:hypothetical protein
MKLRVKLILVLAIVCIIVSAAACFAASSGGPDRAAFEARYQAYKQSCETWLQDHPGAAWRYPGKELMDIGPSGVPFLIEKMAKGEDPQYFPREHAACCVLTKKRFSATEISDAAKNHVLPEMWVRWWQDRSKTPQVFSGLYTKTQSPNAMESLAASTEIRDMGVDAIPLIVEKIRGGDEKMVPLVSEIMGKEVGSTSSAVLAWWSANEKNVRLPDLVK